MTNLAGGLGHGDTHYEWSAPGWMIVVLLLTWYIGGVIFIVTLAKWNVKHHD